ncbi:hypothetical protein [Burkholderia territorii]|uniref:hypothetical protein n=1 Tax=Burkholderia territorii TaxID=1503055 RepID=UPI0007550448|nr:hypothetical protein [Burkholderia territorii]KWO62600.1 hypothetical protein WT98_30505 [Burkholderia territorii]
MLTDVEVFAIRAASLPAHLREKLYPELAQQQHTRACSKCGNMLAEVVFCNAINCPLNPTCTRESP